MQEQAAALHAMGMGDYAALKGRLTAATAGLVALGTLVASVTGTRPIRRRMAGESSGDPLLASGCLYIYRIWRQISFRPGFR